MIVYSALMIFCFSISLNTFLFCLFSLQQTIYEKHLQHFFFSDFSFSFFSAFLLSSYSSLHFEMLSIVLSLKYYKMNCLKTLFTCWILLLDIIRIPSSSSLNMVLNSSYDETLCFISMKTSLCILFCIYITRPTIKMDSVKMTEKF